MTDARARTIAGAILAVALLLRLWDLGTRSLWFDEASEYWVATAALADLPAAVRDGSGDPPLYSLLLHGWMLASRGETWLRLLSVGFSLAGVAGAIAAGRRLGGNRTGLAAGLLVALGAADIRYAQEVGQYALMVGALYWNLFALVRVTEQPDKRNWARWAVTGVLAFHAYYGAIIAVLVPFGCVFAQTAWRRDGAGVRRALVALVAYAAGMLPLHWVLPAQLSRVVSSPASAAGPHGLAELTGWIQQPLSFPLTGWPFSPVPSWVTAPLALVLLVLGMRSQRRLAVWFGASLAASIVVDRANVFPYGFRWGLILCPMTMVLIASGFARPMRARWATVAARGVFAALLLVCVVSLPIRTVRDRYFADKRWAWPETEDMRSMVDMWHAHRTAAQPTYVYYGAAPAFAYYASRVQPALGDRPPTWHLSCWHDGSASYCREGGVYYGRWLRQLDRQQRLLSVFNTLRERPREFWVVFGHLQPEDDTELLSTLVLNGYEIVSAAQGRDAALFLLRRS